MSISISSNTQKIINTKEYRCPKCYLIPFINISTNNNKLFMEIKCTNNHKDSKPFEQMQINCQTNSILNNSCLFVKMKIIKMFLIFYIIVQIVINFIV